MPAVTAFVTVDHFPSSEAEKRQVAQRVFPDLMQAWVDQRIPIPDVAHILVHRPGAIGKNQIQMTHRADVAEAMEEDSGKVTVAVTATDVLAGVEDLLVFNFRTSRKGY